jgi:tetratricopeptide (TPR) repeat protein
LGKIFSWACDYNRADEYYTKSISCFNNAGKEIHRLYSLYNLGDNKYNLHDFKACDSICRIVEEYASELNDSALYVNCINSRLYSSLNLNDLDSAKILLNKYDAIRECYSDSSFSYYELMALYYNKIGDYDKSEKYINEAWNSQLSESDSLYLYYASALLAENRGHIQESLKLYQTYNLIENEYLTGLLNQPITGAQRDYYRTVSELEAMKARNKVTILVASIVICLFIIAYIVLINLNRKRKTQQEIRDYLSTIDELTARDSLNQGRISSLNSQVREMLRQQFEPSDYLYTRYYEQFDDNKKAERLFRVVKTQIDQFTAPKSISRIDDLLNSTFDGIMDKMSSAGLELKEKELLLLRFVLAGFSAKSMAAILDDTHVNINQRKKRLLDKIQIKAPDLMVELRKILNLK